MVKKEVTNYAGVRMNSYYSQSTTAKLEPKIILDSHSISITYDEIDEVSYSVVIRPVEGVQCKKMLLHSDLEDVICFENEFPGIIIRRKIGFPGIAIIEMVVEGTAIK